VGLPVEALATKIAEQEKQGMLVLKASIEEARKRLEEGLEIVGQSEYKDLLRKEVAEVKRQIVWLEKYGQVAEYLYRDKNNYVYNKALAALK